MDFLKDKPGALFRKYLFASIGIALVVSIYSIVDMVAIGQSEGELGAAAMAVLLVPFGINSVIAVLCGIGGSVLMSNARGRGEMEEGHRYFTCAAILMAVIGGSCWLLLYTQREPVLTAFGASDPATLAKAMEYAEPLLAFMPAFFYPQFISAFIRNDGAPNLALTAVITGGVINMFGDWYLVFPLGMGMRGAAVATVSGVCVQSVIMSLHFFSRRCRLRLVRVSGLGKYFRRILASGFGASVLDLGNVVVVVMLNNQIVAYGATTELAVYGVISSVGALFQAVYSGVGLAMQPLVSTNFGDRQYGRMRRFWKYGLTAVLCLAAVFVALCEFWPGALIRLFVVPTPEIMQAAPGIVRLYGLSFLFLGFNIISTYYLQSELHGRQAMLIALLRSVIAISAFVYLLPLALGITGVWLAVPAAEGLTCLLAARFMRRTLAHPELPAGA